MKMLKLILFLIYVYGFFVEQVVIGLHCVDDVVGNTLHRTTIINGFTSFLIDVFFIDCTHPYSSRTTS